MRGNLDENPSAGQLLIGQPDSQYMPRTVHGDGTIDEDGLLTVSGGGGITGTGTAGYVPIFDTANSVTDSTIDNNVTSPNTLTIKCAPGDSIVISSDTSSQMFGTNASSMGCLNGPAGSEIQLSNNGDGGITITDNGIGGITLVTVSASVPVLIAQGLLLMNNIFSAAGTPLPAPVEGGLAMVSDATLPAIGAAYVSGGNVFCLVVSDGATWFTV